MPSFLRVGALSGCLYLPFLSLFPNAHAADTDPVQRGRYRVQVAGCNDCHTAGYILAPDEAPGSTWLTGDQLGWSGPWGTTFTSNLRLAMQAYDEEQRLAIARQANFRPPMPSHKRKPGVDAHPCSYQAIELADCVIITGSNMAYIQPIGSAAGNRPARIARK